MIKIFSNKNKSGPLSDHNFFIIRVLCSRNSIITILTGNCTTKCFYDEKNKKTKSGFLTNESNAAYLHRLTKIIKEIGRLNKIHNFDFICLQEVPHTYKSGFYYNFISMINRYIGNFSFVTTNISSVALMTLFNNNKYSYRKQIFLPFQHQKNRVQTLSFKHLNLTWYLNRKHINIANAHFNYSKDDNYSVDITTLLKNNFILVGDLNHNNREIRDTLRLCNYQVAFGNGNLSYDFNFSKNILTQVDMGIVPANMLVKKINTKSKLLNFDYKSQLELLESFKVHSKDLLFCLSASKLLKTLNQVNKPSNILILGYPCAGKGTISKFLQQIYNYNHISVGDLHRLENKRNTRLGRQIRDLVCKNKIISKKMFDITHLLLLRTISNIKKSNRNLIFDNFPTAINYIPFFYKILKHFHLKKNIILLIPRVSKNIAFNRFINRLVCSSENCGLIYSLSTIFKPNKPNVCDFCGSNLFERIDDNRSYNKFNAKVLFYQYNILPVIKYFERKLDTYSLNNMLEFLCENLTYDYQNKKNTIAKKLLFTPRA